MEKQQQGENFMSNKTKVVVLTQLALLTAIEAIFCFTPLGSLPISPAIVATLAHIPVIIAAIVLGKRAGAYMGFIMGLFSFIVWTFMPPSPAFAPVFTPFYSFGGVSGNIGSLLICFVPRILLGYFAALIYKSILKLLKTDIVSAILAAAISTAIHTFLVLSGIYLFFGNSFAGGKAYIYFIIAWAGLNAVVEISIAAIVAGALIKPLVKIKKLYQ